MTKNSAKGSSIGEKKLYDIREIENRGRFIKPCPGTPKHVCCGYKIIDFAHGCNLGCSYCILNYYFKDYPIEIYSNIESLLAEVEDYLQKKQSITRFGTGEFTDSLLFEEKYPLYRDLIPLISRHKNAILELKTKTDLVEPLMRIKEHDKIIVSWSLNSEYIAKNEEHYAPSIERRIYSAARVQEAGYKLAFHFDPIILYPGWEEDYANTVERLFSIIDPGNIVYISMGTLRFMPILRFSLMETSRIYSTGEFIKGIDNKYRYFRPIRTRMYIKLKGLITKWVNEDIVYMCMESSDVWEDVFRLKNMNTAKLSQRLDEACRRQFELAV